MDGSEYVEFEEYIGMYILSGDRRVHLPSEEARKALSSDTKVYNLTMADDYIEHLRDPNISMNPEYYYFVERENPNKYISDVGIVSYITGNVGPSNYPATVLDRVTKYYTNAIPVDLNKKAGGCVYMSIVYKRTSDPTEAITDLRAVTVSSPDKAPAYITDKNGIVYHKVHNGECPNLNKGSGGDYIYMYSTKDPRAGKPLTDILVRLSDGSSVQHNTPNYKWIKYPDSTRSVNFNSGAGGYDVWVEFLRDSEYTPKTEIGAYIGAGSFISELSPFSYMIIGVSVVTVAGLFTLGAIRKKRKLRKKAEEAV